MEVATGLGMGCGGSKAGKVVDMEPVLPVLQHVAYVIVDVQVGLGLLTVDIALTSRASVISRL